MITNNQLNNPTLIMPPFLAVWVQVSKWLLLMPCVVSAVLLLLLLACGLV
jgi:hypothetical protein